MFFRRKENSIRTNKNAKLSVAKLDTRCHKRTVYKLVKKSLKKFPDPLTSDSSPQTCELSKCLKDSI